MDSFRRLYPEEYHNRFLGEGLRADGRALGEMRPLEVSRGVIASSSGSSFVRLGQTAVVAGVRCEVGEAPASEECIPIAVNVSLLPLCSPHYRKGKPPNDAQVLNTFIRQVVTRAKIISPSELRIPEQPEYSWYLIVDVYCLEKDGNLADAVVLALVGALQQTTIPAVVFSENGEQVLLDDSGAPGRPLSLSHTPIAVTSAVLLEKKLAVDPTLEEEELADAFVTAVFLENGHLCTLQHHGQSSLSDELIAHILDTAASTAASLRRTLASVPL